jgi:hypothetical protein
LSSPTTGGLRRCSPVSQLRSASGCWCEVRSAGGCPRSSSL